MKTINANDIKYKTPDLDVEYDYVVIIDLLQANQRDEFRLSESIINLLNKNYFAHKLYNCENETSFNLCLSTLKQDAVANKKFPIQIVGHGNKNGIGVGENLVKWENFSNDITAINLAMNNSMIINMTTCMGINGIKLNINLEFPFYGILGVKNILNIEMAREINTRIYKKWFRGMKINDIIRSVNSDLGEEILLGISSEGFRIINELKVTQKK